MIPESNNKRSEQRTPIYCRCSAGKGRWFWVAAPDFSPLFFDDDQSAVSCGYEPTAERSRLLAEAIDQVMNTAAFNRELDAEREDAARIATLRETVVPPLIAAAARMGNTATEGKR
jgi:hypothetical protein